MQNLTITMKFSPQQIGRIVKAAKISGCGKRRSAAWAREFLLLNVAGVLRRRRRR